MTQSRQPDYRNSRVMSGRSLFRGPEAPRPLGPTKRPVALASSTITKCELNTCLCAVLLVGTHLKYYDLPWGDSETYLQGEKCELASSVREMRVVVGGRFLRQTFPRRL